MAPWTSALQTRRARHKAQRAQAELAERSNQQTSALAASEGFADAEGPGFYGGGRIAADIVPLSAYNFGQYSAFDVSWEQFPWQQAFHRYNREGPGIVSQSVRIPANTSALVRWGIQKLNTATMEWEEANDDALAMATMRLFRNESESLEALAAKMIKKFDGPGEFIIVRDRDKAGNWAYYIVGKANVTRDHSRPHLVEIRTRPGAERGSHWHREVPISQVFHVHNDDEEWPGLPTSPFQAVVADIETYKLVHRAIGRNYKSRLAQNGVLWFQADERQPQYIQQMIEYAAHTVQDRDERDARSVMPYPLATSGEPPAWIRTHAPLEQIDLDAADYFLRSFCRGTDFPTQMLFDGPGSANRWGDFVVNDYYADYVMFPRCMRIADIITQHVLRPWAEVMKLWDGKNPNHYRVWPDLTDVRTRTDNTDRILALGNAHVLNREALARAVGATPDDMLQIPPGMTEAEWELLLAGRTTEPSVEVVEDVRIDGVPADPRGPRRPPDMTGRFEVPELTENPPQGQPVVARLSDRFDGETWGQDADLILT